MACRVIDEITIGKKEHAMTKGDVKTAVVALKEVLQGDDDFVREAVRAYLQDILEEEMTAALGAGKGERSPGRLGYRSGSYERALVTRVGRIELRVPQDRDGRFSTALFERYQRSEKALVSALTEMYVQGVSTRKVKKITEELCGQPWRSFNQAISSVAVMVRVSIRPWLFSTVSWRLTTVSAKPRAACSVRKSSVSSRKVPWLPLRARM